MMNEKLNEQLSALVDDELTDQEQALLTRQLARDAVLRDRLARYQLISDAMQDRLPDRIEPGFHNRVADALRDEQPVQVPVAATFRWLRPLAGLAVAASVAVVAVLSLQNLRQEAPAGNPAVATAPSAGDYIRAEGAPVPAPSAGNEDLDVYLVNHNEHALNRGMQGMLPYMRIVGQGDGQGTGPATE